MYLSLFATVAEVQPYLSPIIKDFVITKNLNNKNPKTTLNNKGASVSITFPSFKLYCRAIVIKATYWHKNMHQSMELN